MPLVSLKKKPVDYSEEVAEPSPPKEYYPVSMHLGSDEVKKLGLKDAEVGDEFVMVAKVKVSSVSMSQYSERKAYHNVGLNVTEAEISTEGRSDSDLAEKMFGGS